MAWCRTAVRGVVSEAAQPSQPVDGNGELKSGVLGNRDVVAERRPFADALSLRRRQLVSHATDVLAERDLKCGSGVDDRAPVGVASVRRSCVTAQNFFEGCLLAITDEPENVSPFLSAKRADVRRRNRDAYSTVVGWLDEREPDAVQFGVIDAVVWVKILAGHYLSPGAHVVEPSVDVSGELTERGVSHDL
jgi:hypothetical protein